MICLKNRTFAVYKTTLLRTVIVEHRCDLLEKSYLCGIQNNTYQCSRLAIHVVICLKNRTFAVYKTTTNTSACSKGELWFAWKIVPLRYTKQLILCICLTGYRCDLLEKSYLCGIQNNCDTLRPASEVVVICLKNRTFAVYKTTSIRINDATRMLWFAWKIVPLRYTKQQLMNISVDTARCDLLEKSYLCGIQNNTKQSQHVHLSVVICLKNRTFAVYKTTDLM